MSLLSEIRPDDGWEYIACPDCAHITTFPSERLDTEGAPYCPHNHSTIVYGHGPHSSIAWTQMVRVVVHTQER